MNHQYAETTYVKITEEEIKNAVRILFTSAQTAEKTCGMPSAIAGLLCVAWSMADAMGFTDDGMDRLSAGMHALARQIHGRKAN